MTNSNNNKHHDGDKWFWANWDEAHTTAEKYRLVYTTSEAEDAALLAEDYQWERITRKYAEHLAKNEFARILTEEEDLWMYYYINSLQRTPRKYHFPIFPYKFKFNSKDYYIKDRVVEKC